jgi:hypothetical protein
MVENIHPMQVDQVVLVVVVILLEQEVQEHRDKETLEVLQEIQAHGQVVVAAAAPAALEKMDNLQGVFPVALVVMVDSVFNFQPHIEILHNRLDILDLLAHIGLLVVEEGLVVLVLEQVVLDLAGVDLMLELVMVVQQLVNLHYQIVDLVVEEVKETSQMMEHILEATVAQVSSSSLTQPKA